MIRSPFVVVHAGLDAVGARSVPLARLVQDA